MFCKILISCAIFLFVTVNVFGQQYELKGKVMNQANEPAFVYTSLLQHDSVRVQQTVTDSIGCFSLKVPRGQYLLVMEQFGNVYLKRMVILDTNMDLGDFRINETTELQGVTITAGKKLIEQKVDRLVFHVENATVATGGTALDALKAVPTVRVQNEAISIVGKGEVLVMIDERLQRMSQEDLVNLLKSIPADNIKSIEVITTPPARYDAEGNAGLINIKLKAAKADSWNANVGVSYTQRTYASGSVQGLFNYNHNKLALQASVSKGIEKLLTTSDSRIFYPDTWWRQEAGNRTTRDIWSLGLGLDYHLTGTWKTGIKYLGSFTNRTSLSHPFTTRFNQVTETAHAYIASNVDASNKPGMNGFNWYHAVALDSSGKNLTVDLDYFGYNKKDRRFFSGNELDSYGNVIPNAFFASANGNSNTVRNYSGKVNFSMPYKWADISFGGKASYTSTANNLVVYDNRSGVPVLDKDQSNIFNYQEYSEALYCAASKKLSKQWEAQAGLRMEATQTLGYSQTLDQTNKNNYVRLFPTAYLTYAANDSNSFSLTYSRRIRRPDFDYLNPFEIRTSPYYYYEGNPYLKPSFTDNLELSYIRNQNWVSSIYYAKVSDFGQELPIIDARTNITKSTPVNYADAYQLGLSMYYNFNKLTWWNSVTGFNVNYQNVKSKTAFIRSVDGYNAYCYSNNEFTLGREKTIFLGLNYGLQLPGQYQVFHISTIHILDVSMKFLLYHKSLSVTLTGEDLLNMQKPVITSYSNGVKNSVKSYSDIRGFRIAINYKLGRKEMSARQRSSGNEEERSRTN